MKHIDYGDICKRCLSSNSESLREEWEDKFVSDFHDKWSFSGVTDAFWKGEMEDKTPRPQQVLEWTLKKTEKLFSKRQADIEGLIQEFPKKNVIDLFPEAKVTVPSVDLSYQVTFKNGYNEAIEKVIHHLKSLL